MNIGVDVTSFGNEEIINKTLSLSTSIFTADLLDGFAALGKAGHFTLIAGEAHESFFRERFPQYRTVPVKSPPFSILAELSGGKSVPCVCRKRRSGGRPWQAFSTKRRDFSHRDGSESFLTKSAPICASWRSQCGSASRSGSFSHSRQESGTTLPPARKVGS